MSGGFDEMLRDAQRQPIVVEMELAGRGEAHEDALRAHRSASRQRAEREADHEPAPDAVELERLAVAEDLSVEHGSGGGGGGAGGAGGGGGAVGSPPSPQQTSSQDVEGAEAAGAQDAEAEDAREQDSAVEPVEEAAQQDSAPPRQEPQEAALRPGPAAPGPEGYIASDRPTPGQLLEFVPVGFSHEGEDTVLKKFPKPLVERLREMLAGHVGREFADKCSTSALVTAFMVAKLGISYTTDANTTRAMHAFRELEPQLSVLENNTAEMYEGLQQLGAVVRAMGSRLREVGDSLEGVELSNAYLVMSRLVGLNTDTATERNLEVDQPRVLVAREQIRSRALAVRAAQLRRDNAGRGGRGA